MESNSLVRFFDDINAKKCEFGIQDAEVNDIQDAVTEMIKNAMEKMSGTDIRLAMSQILPTGGYFEETKISNPDEFDYMVECYFLSQPSELSYEPGCTGCVKPKPKSPEKWSEFCNDGYLIFTRPTYDGRSENLVEESSFSIKDAINMLLENCVDEIDHEIAKPTGTLTFCGFSLMTFGLFWKSFSSDTQASNPDFGEISVDIMPAIECPKEHITMSNRSFPEHLLDEATASGVYIVPKKCHVNSSHACCQLSFSRVELSLIRKLGEHHKKCYKILKFISGKLGLLFIDSYALKTSMLHHHYNEKCLETEDDPRCIISVLKYLKTCSENGFLSALFVPEKNIWGFSDIQDDEPFTARRYQNQASLLALLIDILDQIASIDVDQYDFEENLGIIGKMAEYLSKYSEGRMKVPKVVDLTTKYMSKWKKQHRHPHSRQSQNTRQNREGPRKQSNRRFSCAII